MVLSHWGLTVSPFRQPEKPAWFYHGPVQEEILARLQFLIEHRHPSGVLVGSAGSGKSLLLQVLSKRLTADGREHLNINLRGCDRHEICWQLAVGLKTQPSPNDSPYRLWRRVYDRLQQLRTLERDLLLIVDDAGEGCPDGIEVLTHLLALNRWPESRVSIILGCRPEQLSHLGPRLLQEAELRVEIEPLTELEVGEFLNASLAHAGCRDPLFSNGAINRLHVLSGGNPRRLNHLAELALIAAASQKIGCVDMQTVEGVHQQLDQAARPPYRKAA
ncbi:AAA domain-containing protein [Planctomycetales bacterium 10988]|nr:AAA domain-containing protein [Planctomycetales bacterium 10988]